jgi:hypothetical protein
MPDRPTGTPEEEARERVSSDNCPECGHSVGWHGENHDDGCNATYGCPCGLNARDCHAKIDKSAALDAYRSAVRTELLAELRAEIEGMRFDVKYDDPNHDGAEERCSYCVDAEAIDRVLAALDRRQP